MRKLQGRKWFFYGGLGLLLILCYLLQTIPGLFCIAGVKPILLAGFATAVSMRVREIPAAVFGVLCGLLWDFSSPSLFGFHGLIFFVGAVAVSLLSQYLIQQKLINFLLLSGIMLTIDRLLYFLFYYGIWRYAGSGLVLTHELLPGIGYSLLAGVPIYYVCRYFISRFGETDF